MRNVHRAVSCLFQLLYNIKMIVTTNLWIVFTHILCAWFNVVVSKLPYPCAVVILLASCELLHVFCTCLLHLWSHLLCVAPYIFISHVSSFACIIICLQLHSLDSYPCIYFGAPTSQTLCSVSSLCLLASRRWLYFSRYVYSSNESEHT